MVVHSTFVEINSVYHLPSSRSRRRPRLLPALLVFFIFLSPPSPSRFPFSPSPRSAALSLVSSSVSDSYSYSVFAVTSVKWAFVIERGHKPRKPFLHPVNVLSPNVASTAVRIQQRGETTGFCTMQESDSFTFNTSSERLTHRSRSGGRDTPEPSPGCSNSRVNR